MKGVPSLSVVVVVVALYGLTVSADADAGSMSRAAADTKSGAGSKKKASMTSMIKHIIVLMMENRSFDHLLGWLKEDSNPKVDGLEAGKSCPRDPQDASQGSLEINRAGFDVSPDDPLHDYQHIFNQINGGAMDGFVKDALSVHHNELNPVSMFDKNSAPIINTLAEEFAVFDDWFCSIPGPTDPNRAFAMAGTSLGVLTNFNGTLWNQQSYFDYLRQNGHSFAGYYQDDPWALMYFEDTNKPPNSRFMKDLDLHFYKDLQSGDMPEFVWLQPRMVTRGSRLPTWQHPDASVIEGERLIKEVYEAIRASDIWNSTLFLITYDEHGGFYDHVAPPSENVPPPDDNVNVETGFKFDRLGVRIPTLAISPFVSKGSIINSHSLPDESIDLPTPNSKFDSTSILATANKILNVSADPMGNRMAWAATFTSVLRSTPRDDCISKLPELPSVPTHSYETQRAKPLNHHLEAQLLFYCMRNNESHEDQRDCLKYVEKNCATQGAASDWIMDQVAIYTARLRAAEVKHDEELSGNQM